MPKKGGKPSKEGDEEEERSKGHTFMINLHLFLYSHLDLIIKFVNSQKHIFISGYICFLH